MQHDRRNLLRRCQKSRTAYRGCIQQGLQDVKEPLMASSPRRWKWTESLHVVLPGWQRPCVRGQPQLDRGIRGPSASPWEFQPLGRSPPFRRGRRWRERGVGRRRRREIRAGGLQERIRSCPQSDGAVAGPRTPSSPAEDVEQFAGWVRVKIFFVARRSVNLSDSDGTARHGTVCDDTDDRPEEQEMFGRFFVEAVSSVSSSGIHPTAGGSMCGQLTLLGHVPMMITRLPSCT